MTTPFSAFYRNGSIHLAVVDGRNLITGSWSLAATLAALDHDRDIRIEMESDVGVVEVFTDIDRLLCALSSTQKLC